MKRKMHKPLLFLHNELMFVEENYIFLATVPVNSDLDDSQGSGKLNLLYTMALKVI